MTCCKQSSPHGLHSAKKQNVGLSNDTKPRNSQFIPKFISKLGTALNFVDIVD